MRPLLKKLERRNQLVDNRTVNIWIIRHAKSSWADPHQTDFERPLNHRGERDGLTMQRWLSEQDAPADWIWTSDATRALATSSFIEKAFWQVKPQIVADHRLYHADPDANLSILKETPEDARSVALVAHNPGLTHLVNLLGATEVTDNLPTFGVARFSYAGQWADLEFGQATLDYLVSPKRLNR
ncbi:MAG: phosphoglycerate mutase [Gammaproteobacteria bacterium]|nr:MAG: phosphoglycerate mutase [Gammaproteobacteria bacterium]